MGAPFETGRSEICPEKNEARRSVADFRERSGRSLDRIIHATLIRTWERAVPGHRSGKVRHPWIFRGRLACEHFCVRGRDPGTGVAAEVSRRYSGFAINQRRLRRRLRRAMEI